MGALYHKHNEIEKFLLQISKTRFLHEYPNGGYSCKVYLLNRNAWSSTWQIFG